MRGVRSPPAIGGCSSSRHVRRPASRKRPAARCALRIATIRPAPRSTRRRPLDGHAVHGGLQQPGGLRSRASRTARQHRARPRDRGLERRRQGPHLQAARRREVARRQAVHAADVNCTFDMLTGRANEAAPESAQVVVLQCRAGDRQRRLEVTFHLGRPQPSLLACSPAAIRRSIPATCRRRRCAPSRSAPGPSSSSSSSRTRHQAREERRLLEKGPALSRRHRVHHRAQPRDAMLGFASGRFDITFPASRRPAAEGHQEPGAKAICEMLTNNTHQSARQSRHAAVRQSRPPQRHGAGDRPQGLHRHHQPGHQRDRRHHAAAAGRPVGHAAGDPRHRCRATVPTSRRSARKAARS